MTITIHRGAHEIGGNCIEFSADGTRIILDLGMPLVAPGDKKKKFDSFSMSRKTTGVLVKEGTLPDVAGLYEGVDRVKSVDAVIISHPHQDHYGLVGYLRNDVPVHISAEALKIIEASDLFLPIKANIKRAVIYEDRKPFRIGPFTITAYLMDHSAFGAYAFVIEADGKKVFYSGDFRGHGRKAKLFQKFLRTAPTVDYALMEGTTLDRPDRHFKSEEDLEADTVKAIKKYKNLKLLHVSAQNIDRIVTFYRAAIKTGSLFVVDLYGAQILSELSTFAKIPHPNASYKHLRVFFSKKMMTHLYRQNRKDIVYKFRAHEIGLEELKKNREKVMMIFRESLLDDVKKIGELKGSVLIYSMFSGYMKEPRFDALKSYMAQEDIALEVIHTSGHASFKDIKKLVGALKPKTLIPIHTFNPKAYAELHENVRPLADGVPIKLV